jgi:hypothetical protein
MKNWVSIFKSIKTNQYKNYITYLQNDNHKNHNVDDNHNIINFIKNSKKVEIENLKILDEQNYKKILNGKGGRPSSSFGVSVVLSIPFGLDEENYKTFLNELLKKYYIDICKINKIQANQESYQKWKSLVFYNIHTKDIGSKTQFNFVFPHYIFNKKVLQEKKFLEDEKFELETIKIDMSKKKYSHLFKILSTKLIRKNFELDVEDYEKIEQKTMKKRQSTKYYKSNKKVQELEERVEFLENKKQKQISINEDLTLERQLIYKSINEIKSKLEKYIEEIKQGNVVDKTLDKYIERLEKSIENEEIEKMKKQEKLVEKRIKKVKSYGLGC